MYYYLYLGGCHGLRIVICIQKHEVYFFCGGFALFSSGIVIFIQFSQEPKTVLQFERLSGDELLNVH